MNIIQFDSANIAFQRKEFTTRWAVYGGATLLVSPLSITISLLIAGLNSIAATTGQMAING